MRLLLIALISFHAFGFGEHLTPLQKWAMEIGYKEHLLSKSKSNLSPARNCIEEFNNLKKSYNDKICAGESSLIEFGMISGKKFTRDDIQNMPTSHPHLRSTIRGTNRLIDYAVYSSAPRFPHGFSECERFFVEKVEIIDMDGKLCREIKFGAPELGGEFYSQIYCEESASIFMTVN